jgi:hypothetical protein
MTSFISYIFKDTKKKLALFAIPVLHFPMLEKKVNRYLLPQRKQGRAGISEPRGNRNDIIHLIHFQVHKEKAGAFCNTSASFSDVGRRKSTAIFYRKESKRRFGKSEPRGNHNHIFPFDLFQGHEEKADAFCRISSFNYSVFT